MTEKQVHGRDERADKLRVFQYDEKDYYVENSEGKICYRVTTNNGSSSCTCADFVTNRQKDANFLCKHIMAAANANGSSRKVLMFTKPRLDDRFIMEIEGREFVKYPGLLDLGHQKGIEKIIVDPLQFPNKDNGQCAICKATIVAKTGELFSDIGDANPDNCNKKVARHLLRMSSTRAIARALRSYTNIGLTCLDELTDFSEALPDDGKQKQQKAHREATYKGKEENAHVSQAGAPGANTQKQQPTAPAGAPDTSKKPATAKEEKAPSGSAKPSVAQIQAIENLAKRRNISRAELDEMAKKQYGAALEEISAQDASAFIRTLQQAA